ncbi:MAG: glutamate synthase subunit alpha, partial [Truepera sp.]|nr:glutamate synthase subunit alpha [Truepera sp.]
SVIIGNTVLYGATGGSLYAAGKAGERLCVRNSGGYAVVEGCGDHGCEYMTGGVAVILGEAGRNFGAGMSGGVAYVYDPEGVFPGRVNRGMVELTRLAGDSDEALLKTMIARHYALTLSPQAKAILDGWEAALTRFWKVAPRPMSEDATAQEQDPRLLEAAALQAILAEASP